MMMFTRSQLETLLPLAIRWVEEEEERILRQGTPLDESQLELARLIGVAEPDRIRVWKAAGMPAPGDPVLMAAMQLAGMSPSQAMGISFRYGIYLHASIQSDRRVLAHELTHTLQYERLGSIEAFLQQYVAECLDPGYPAGPLEQEARRMEAAHGGV